LLILAAWSALLAAVGLAAAFHAWGGEDPLHGLRAGRRALGREGLAGLALGLASMLAVGAAYSVLGWVAWEVEPQAGTIWPALALSAGALLPAAAAEEIVFRGYVLRTLETWRGWPLALAVSSVLFGLAHAANPNVTGLALANIALAGAAFALTYRLAGRRLWLPIAYHFLWNYAQGPLLGFPVSGLGFGAAARATVEGPPAWTGGAFGPEGGLVVTAILLLTCGGLWLWGREEAGRE
jgi:membrane protease YdiL (CAAX protease family)